MVLRALGLTRQLRLHDQQSRKAGEHGSSQRRNQQRNDVTGRWWNNVPRPVTHSLVETNMNKDAKNSQKAAIAEVIEGAAWTDLFRRAPREVQTDLGLHLAQIGGALVMTARAIPHPLLNRALGCSAAPAELTQVVEHFIQRDIHKYFLHLPQAARSPRIEQQLAALGVARYRRSWVKLIRGSEPAAPVKTALNVRPATQNDAGAVGRIYCDAFDLPASCIPLIGSAVGRPGWSVWVGQEGDAITSVGLLYVNDDFGYLAGGATLPRYRGRGYQGALVSARVHAALRLGCRYIASETGEDVPDDPQHSFRNMTRAGFEVIGVRDNYAPTGSIWNHGRRTADVA